ncbi:MAG: sugar ABC transporter permease [Chloroflexota bacterium]|nr:sugar ABC transporter permease [Chloroflexota bacterium]
MTSRDLSARGIGGADELAATEWGDEKGVRATLRAMRRSWQAYALLFPIFALLIVFVYYPPILGLVRAFYEWAPLRPARFVGFENFVNYFIYPESGREIANVLKLTYMGFVTGVIAPFVMAELIFSIRETVSKEIYRFAIVIPMLVPGVVYTLLWQHIFDPNLGPINSFLRGVGLNHFARNWLGDPATALYAIIAVGFPWVSGIGTLVFLGGLAQISESVFDACLIDGCTGLRRIWQVDIPLVLGQVRFLTILSVIGSLTTFERVMILTRGGPGYATSVPGLRMYERAFVTGEFGYASAIGLLLFAFALFLLFVINRLLRPHTEEISH